MPSAPRCQPSPVAPASWPRAHTFGVYSGVTLSHRWSSDIRMMMFGGVAATAGEGEGMMAMPAATKMDEGDQIASLSNPQGVL